MRPVGRGFRRSGGAGRVEEPLRPEGFQPARPGLVDAGGFGNGPGARHGGQHREASGAGGRRDAGQAPLAPDLYGLGRRHEGGSRVLRGVDGPNARSTGCDRYLRTHHRKREQDGKDGEKRGNGPHVAVHIRRVRRKQGPKGRIRRRSRRCVPVAIRRLPYIGSAARFPDGCRAVPGACGDGDGQLRRLTADRAAPGSRRERNPRKARSQRPSRLSRRGSAEPECRGGFLSSSVATVWSAAPGGPGISMRIRSRASGDGLGPRPRRHPHPASR